MVERLEVHLAGYSGMLEDRLDLGGEEQRAVLQGVVERLHAEPIPGEQHPSPASVPEGEGELALQLVDARLPALLVKVDDRLRVRPAAIPVTAGLEPAPKRLVVVDLAVEDDPDGFVLVRHRLAAGGREIHDGEPAVAQPHRPVEQDAVVVRSAVGEALGHALQQAPLDRLPGRELGDAGDPAHR